MTIISSTQHNKQKVTKASILPLYQGTDDNETLGNVSKIGLEIEYTLFDKKTGAPLSKQQNTQIIQTGKKRNIAVNQEPSAALLELTSKPYPKYEIKTLLKELCYDAHNLHTTAEEQNIGISPYGQLPKAQLTDHSVVDLERYQTFFTPPRQDMIETYRFFASCLNIQTSISYRNSCHLLKIIRLLTALEPVIFLSTDSSSGFSEGKAIKHVHNLAQKDKLGINAGIPDFYYYSKTGAELIDNHINFTMNNPHVFAYFNNEGKLQRLPTQQWTSFNQLKEKNIGSASISNYLQAQRENWRRACNIATIIDGQGNIIGHRAELAAFQTGLMHQRATAAALTSFIAYDEIFYEKTKNLLMKCGINLDDLANNKGLLENNFKNACYHNNQYHSINFGNGTIKDFVIPFSNIIEAAAERANLSYCSSSIIHIMRSGRPDWLVYRETFTTLQETLDYMHNFDTHAKNCPDLLSPWSCADMAFQKMGMNKNTA